MTQKTNSINDDELTYQLEYDRNKNDDSTPPVDEKIQVLSIWVFEAYTPSNIENFHKGVEKLGWGKDFWSVNPDFQDKVDEMRFQSSASGWLNLGFVVDSSSTNAWPGTKKADLPEGISHVRMTILQFLPSTTILACQFILSSDLTNSVEEALREKYYSYKEPIGSGYIIHDVVNQKRDSVTLARTFIKDLCSKWIKNNFPGLFSNSEIDGNFPTCELFTFEKYEPCINENKLKFDNYLWILNLDNYIDTWSSDDLENIFLTIDETRDNADKFNIVLFCNVNKALTDKDTSLYGENNKDKLTGFLSYMDKTFGLWVLYVVAKTYDRALAKLRDSLGQVGDLSSYDSNQKLINIERSFLDIQRNTIPFIYELKEYCKDKRSFLYDVYEFKAVHEIRQKHPPLFESVRNNLLSISKYLEFNIGSLETSTKACRQIASVNSSNWLAKTNISLQKIMSWMTFVMLIFTIITTLSSFEQLKNLFDLLKNFIIKYYITSQ